MKTQPALIPYSPLAILILGLCLIVVVLPVLVSAKEKWDPIAAEDLAATECTSYPGSNAELLLEKQVLNSSGDNQMMHHYRRIKIYRPKGADEAGVFNIDFPTDQNVSWVAARLTKQNGSATEFSKKEFTESLAAKTDSIKVKRLTLAVPDLGAGDILEMKWSEFVSSDVSTYQWWYFQDVMPVRHFIFSIEGTVVDCRLLSFNRPPSDKKPDGPKAKGTTLEIYDIPPYVEEPAMPPTRDVRGWFLLLYTDAYMRWFTKDDVWKELSMYWEEEYRFLTKPGAPIKTKAAELVKGATTDEEKLKRLYDFVQEHVTNIDYFDSADLQAAKKKLENKDGKQEPAQTLRLQTGYSHHLNELFAALARAAGYEVRQARSASRHETLTVRHSNGWLFVHDDLVAVKIGETWRYYAPGDYYVPAGMLDKSNETATSLISDPKKIIFEQNPVSKAEKSPVVRKGRFRLDAEGNLEGEIEVSLSGHAGITRKKSWRSMQQEEIDADYRADITKRLPAAEVSDLQWENLKGNKLPLIVKYKLKIPAYADVAGSKIILPTNVFEHGAPAVFTSETRKHPIFFDHAWSESDDIEIALPEGYTLEAGSAPANVGDTAGVVGARYQLAFKPKAGKLLYKREFALGGNGVIAVQAVSYPQLKTAFDAIQRSDEHTLVVKPKPVAPEQPDAPAPPPAS